MILAAHWLTKKRRGLLLCRLLTGQFDYSTTYRTESLSRIMGPSIGCHTLHRLTITRVYGTGAELLQAMCQWSGNALVAEKSLGPVFIDHFTTIYISIPDPEDGI